MIRRQFLLAALAAGTLLAGCATAPEEPRTPKGTRFSGRFSYAPRVGRAFSGKYVFEDRGAVQTLDLLTPLNGVLARVTQDAREARLETSSGDETVARNSEELMRSQFGFGLPLATLRLWMAGRPDPARPSEALAGADGFVQGPWTVTVLRRQSNVPVLLSLACRTSRQDFTLRVTLQSEPVY